MTDGNTDAINRHLAERETYDEQQEREAELQDLRDEVDTLIAKLADVEDERDAKLAKAVVALDIAESALNIMAWDEGFTCFDDVKWEMVNSALDKTRMTSAELKSKAVEVGE